MSDIRATLARRTAASETKPSETLLVVDPRTALDTITILRVRDEHRPLATKRWLRDGRIRGNEKPLTFAVEERPINSVYDLATVLREIEHDPHALVIRGKLRDDAVAVQRERLPAWNEERERKAARAGQAAPTPLNPSEGEFLRRGALFDDVPHHWVMLDVDGFAPSVDPIAKPVAAIGEYVATLPAAFHYTSYFWQLSSSTGHPTKTGLRAHVWFWLRQPVTSAQLKAWAEAEKVSTDRSLFNAVQAHYTARPVFDAGVADRVPVRSGFFDLSRLGDDDVVLELPAVVATRPSSQQHEPQQSVELTDEQVADLRAALAYCNEKGIAAFGTDDRDTRIKIVQNLKSAGERGREIAREVCTGPGRWSDERFDEVFDEPGGDRSDYRAIFATAQACGWVNPAGSRRSDTGAEGFDGPAPSFESLCEEIEQQPADADPAEFTRKIIASAQRAALPPVQAEVLLGKLQAAASARRVKLGIGVLRKQWAKAAKAADVEGDTHHNFANDFIEALTARSENERPIGAEGCIFTYGDGIWAGREPSQYEGEIARRYDGRRNCERKGDYGSIAQHAYTLACEGGKHFFSQAPVGVATGQHFYRLAADGALVREPLGPQHRARYALSIEPVEGPAPLFERFLAQTFASEQSEEAAEQIALLQEVMGATVMGLMARQQKAVLFIGEARAGKGTITRILEELIPQAFRCATSPFVWDSEYNVAHLAGRRLNVVGELDEGKYLPAAVFKTVTGGDTLQGRHPTHRPFEFRSEAAHIFSTNHLINTRDVSEGFFSRWLILGFANSRLALGEGAVDVHLDRRIIEQELPQVLSWAMHGAVRLAKRIEQGKSFSTGRVHHEWMSKWRRRASNVLEFLHDEDACELGAGHEIGRTTLFSVYRAWCSTVGRAAISRSEFFREIENPAVRALGITVRARTMKARETVVGVREGGLSAELL